jgi:iron complex transport system ATP-binding protein
MSEAPASEVVRFEGVSLWRSSHGVRKVILDSIDWTVEAGQHWGIVGPNGAGKTTLLRIASAQMRPSAGAAWILGARLGRVPLHELRRHIGLVEPALGRRFYPEQRVIDIVLSGLTGTILLADELPDGAAAKAQAALIRVAAAPLATREFASCSEGERARVLLARGLMTDAPLLSLDEPAAGLDLPGRELLLEAFDQALRERSDLTTLTVTHHLEELPSKTSHALLLRDGCVVAAGPVDEALTEATLSECFGLELRFERVAGRLFVHAASRSS